MCAIVVSDTNIFIDLLSIDLLDKFFQLPIEIHTTDFVVNELLEEQKLKLLSLGSDRLYVKSYTMIEISSIAEFHATCENNVSFIDCSVWCYAKDNSFQLLTGDKKLRNSAAASGVKVRGVLYIFDQLIEHNIITQEIASLKLKSLVEKNERLPKVEINKRLAQWGSI